MNEDALEKGFSLLEIAMVKAWNYAHEYDPVSGREVEKHGFYELRDGYIQGFLAGFAYRITGDDEGN